LRPRSKASHGSTESTTLWRRPDFSMKTGRVCACLSTCPGRFLASVAVTFMADSGGFH
jgi:hypothetical protein